MADLTGVKVGDRLRVRWGRWLMATDSADHTVCKIIKGFVLTNSGLSFDVFNGIDGPYTAELDSGSRAQIDQP